MRDRRARKNTSGTGTLICCTIYSPARSYAPFVSSVRYASRACHDRLECARKDDLESWLFMSVEFYHINILSWRSMSNLAEIRREKEAFMSERGVHVPTG